MVKKGADNSVVANIAIGIHIPQHGQHVDLLPR